MIYSWPFIYVCKFCAPCEGTFSTAGCVELKIIEKVCDYHMKFMAESNEKWNERHRHELWLELL